MNELEREVVDAAVEWVNQSRHGRHEKQYAKDLRDAVDRLVDENDGRWPPADSCKHKRSTWTVYLGEKWQRNLLICESCEEVLEIKSVRRGG